MVCAEFQRLKQEYERTLRVWAHYAFPLPRDVIQFPGRLSELKYEAQRERDRADRRLSAHKETCPFCSNCRPGEASRRRPGH
jgi:hypothetical protein